MKFVESLSLARLELFLARWRTSISQALAPILVFQREDTGNFSMVNNWFCGCWIRYGCLRSAFINRRLELTALIKCHLPTEKGLIWQRFTYIFESQSIAAPCSGAVIKGLEWRQTTNRNVTLTTRVHYTSSRPSVNLWLLLKGPSLKSSSIMSSCSSTGVAIMTRSKCPSPHSIFAVSGTIAMRDRSASKRLS